MNLIVIVAEIIAMIVIASGMTFSLGAGYARKRLIKKFGIGRVEPNDTYFVKTKTLNTCHGNYHLTLRNNPYHSEYVYKHEHKICGTEVQITSMQNTQDFRITKTTITPRMTVVQIIEAQAA